VRRMRRHSVGNVASVRDRAPRSIPSEESRLPHIRRECSRCNARSCRFPLPSTHRTLPVAVEGRETVHDWLDGRGGFSVAPHRAAPQWGARSGGVAPWPAIVPCSSSRAVPAHPVMPSSPHPAIAVAIASFRGEAEESLAFMVNHRGPAPGARMGHAAPRGRRGEIPRC